MGGKTETDELQGRLVRGWKRENGDETQENGRQTRSETEKENR